MARGAVSGQLKVSLHKWAPPNFATIAGSDEANARSIHVVDLSIELLDNLAEAWLQDLYKKAGKSNPFVIAPGIGR